MNILIEILKQDAIMAREHQKLINLQKKYVIEHKKYNVDDIVSFKQYEYDDNLIKGRVKRFYFKEVSGKGLIQYCIIRVNNDGSENKRDRSFYFRHESEIQ